MTQQTATPLSNAEQILDRITTLQEALQNNAPGYEGLLQQIHTALHKDPDCVHLLSDEQIGIICSGLAKKKQVVIATSGTKKTSGGKALKNVTLDDL